MKSRTLTRIPRRTKPGTISPRRVLESLELLSDNSLAFATLDRHRALRQGFPEVVLGEGKTPSQVAAIARKLSSSGPLLVTRANRDIYRAVRRAVPKAHYHEIARTITANEPQSKRGEKYTLIVTAGTSDIPVAEEAAVCARMMGQRVETLYDVGVAGIHRVLSGLGVLREAAVIIVVAGMDGALPSVVGGLVKVPVIAVPTSTGYGASLNGVAALLTMLNSCASGIVVVNIDNGFGAAFAARRILAGG